MLCVSLLCSRLFCSMACSNVCSSLSTLCLVAFSDVSSVATDTCKFVSSRVISRIEEDNSRMLISLRYIWACSGLKINVLTIHANNEEIRPNQKIVSSIGISPLSWFNCYFKWVIRCVRNYSLYILSAYNTTCTIIVFVFKNRFHAFKLYGDYTRPIHIQI